MVRRRMMLGEVVSEVVASSTDNLLVLGDVVLDPVKKHVHGFGVALRDCVIDDARCVRIVSQRQWTTYWSWATRSLIQ